MFGCSFFENNNVFLQVVKFVCISDLTLCYLVLVFESSANVMKTQ